MLKPHFTQEQLVQVARLSDGDIEFLNACRGAQNKIGNAYQICYVKLFNRFPAQSSFEILLELAAFVAMQVGVGTEQLQRYAFRQPTISAHQEQIRKFLGIQHFTPEVEGLLRHHLFEEALQIQESESLFLKATEYLRAAKILNPTDYTVERLVKAEREKARNSITNELENN